MTTGGEAQIGLLTVDERVEDAHGAVGDTGVRVDLLEDYATVSVDGRGK